MKKHLTLSAIILALGVFLFAQEKTEVSMKVIKDGKVVKDTTYAFEDVKKAKHAVHMFDAMASEKLDIYISDSDDHMEFIHKEGNEVKQGKKAVFISEDGKKKVIKKEIIVIDDEEGEGGTWTIKEGKDGEVVKWKKIEGDDGEVIVIKKTRGEGDEEEIEVEVISKEKMEDIKKKEKKKSKK